MSPVGRESLVTPEPPLVCLDSPLLLLDCSARGGGGNGPEKENGQRVDQFHFSRSPMGHLIDRWSHLFRVVFSAFFRQICKAYKPTRHLLNWANMQNDTFIHVPRCGNFIILELRDIRMGWGSMEQRKIFCRNNGCMGESTADNRESGFFSEPTINHNHT